MPDFQWIWIWGNCLCNYTLCTSGFESGHVHCACPLFQCTLSPWGKIFAQLSPGAVHESSDMILLVFACHAVACTFCARSCFTPQRRAKSAPRMKCCWPFWLRNLLRATTACIWSLSRPDGSAPAALASLLQPSGATKHSKNMEQHSVSRLSYLFLHLDFLSSVSFSSDSFSSDSFSSLPFPTSAFSICPYCRKFDF